jgi:hypothetical protein
VLWPFDVDTFVLVHLVVLLVVVVTVSASSASRVKQTNGDWKIAGMLLVFIIGDVQIKSSAKEKNEPGANRLAACSSEIKKISTISFKKICEKQFKCKTSLFDNLSCNQFWFQDIIAEAGRR